MEGAEARLELPPQKRTQAYVEVLPELLRRFSARSATDGDKMLVCAKQLPLQADGPIVLYSEAARVFVRIQPNPASRQVLADPGGQQWIDMILRHAGSLKDKPAHPCSSLAAPLAQRVAPTQPSPPRLALAVGSPWPWARHLGRQRANSENADLPGTRAECCTRPSGSLSSTRTRTRACTSG